MPRRRGGHQSISVSPLDMLEEEVFSFRNQQNALFGHMEQLGTTNDGPDLRKSILELKQGLAVAESSISNRLKGEVMDSEAERHASLEDSFFELKANYFSLLRQCVAAESVQMPQAVPSLPPRSSAPDVQRYGNPHTSPGLQMQGGPPPGYTESQQDPYPPQYEHAPGQMQEQQITQQNALVVDGVQLQSRDSMYWDAKEIVEREEEFKLISSEMVHLQDAFQDVAVEADTQTEKEEIAEQHVVVAKVNTKEGVQTLGKSAKNSKKILLPGAGAGFGGVAGGVAGGVIGTLAGGALTVPGVVVGAAIGASCGATFGHGVGKIIRKTNDKDMAKARLNENWTPDSSTKFCEGCAKKFTQINRRHHCRNCGGLFCSKCTKHKMYIPGVSTESRPRVCRKCFEALMYNQQGIKPPTTGAIGESTAPDLPQRLTQ